MYNNECVLTSERLTVNNCFAEGAVLPPSRRQKNECFNTVINLGYLSELTADTLLNCSVGFSTILL